MNEDSSKKEAQEFSFSQMELEQGHPTHIRMANSKDRVSTNELESAGNFGQHMA
jgi:hypothetical protein